MTAETTQRHGYVFDHEITVSDMAENSLDDLVTEKTRLLAQLTSLNDQLERFRDGQLERGDDWYRRCKSALKWTTAGIQKVNAAITIRKRRNHEAELATKTPKKDYHRLFVKHAERLLSADDYKCVLRAVERELGERDNGVET